LIPCLVDMCHGQDASGIVELSQVSFVMLVSAMDKRTKLNMKV
jgi:hypothetical protein